MANGTGIWLLACWTGDPTSADAALVYGVAMVAVFLGITIAILRRPAPGDDTQALCRDAGMLAAAAMIAISPHYYWYFAWLALPAVIAPRRVARALLWLATAPLLLVIGPIPHDQFIWRSLVYVPATLLLLAESPPPAHDQIPAPRRIGRHRMSTTTALKDPRRYFEEIGADRPRSPSSRRFAFIWRSPTAATCCAKPARAHSRSWSHRPT